MEPKNPFAPTEEVKTEAKEPTNVASDAMTEILDRLEKLEKENAELKK